jgi:phospholipid transport system substrate-binding protein
VIRRTVVVAGLTLAAGRGFVVPASAQAPVAEQPGDAARAVDFIRISGEELAAIVQDHVPALERRRRMQAFLDRVVDVDGLARFCLGRFWVRATDAQRAAYTSLYHGVLLNAVLARVGDYGGPQMRTVFGRAELRDEMVLVPTTLERPGQPEAGVTWALRMDGAAPRIIDLIVEGTSLRVTVRSDYAAFLNSHNDSIDALIEALRLQAAPPPRAGG